MKTTCWAILFSMIWLAPGTGEADRYLYPESELLNSAFTDEWFSSGTLTGRTSLPSSAVRFEITLGPGGTTTAIGDDWAIEPTAGLAWDGGYLPGDPGDPHAGAHSNISIADWDGIQMPVTYVSGPGEIQMRLFMHTGMTGGSGYPSWTNSNDTKWHGPMQTLSVGETLVLDLDFANADTWNATDNLYPHSGHGQGWANGTWHAINERDRREVSNMGIEIYGPAAAQIVLDANSPVPEPSSLLLAALAGLSWLLLRRRSRAIVSREP